MGANGRERMQKEADGGEQMGGSSRWEANGREQMQEGADGSKADRSKCYINTCPCAACDVVVPVITPMNRLPVFGHEKSPLHPAAQNVPPKDKVGSAQLDSACARMCVCVCVCLCVCVRVGVCAHAQALISPINKRSNH
eukprot:scaffold206860_cov20-Tisochrysis_lutea.AAC.2